MLGMGWPELFVVAAVAACVFGPERLPDIARQAGQLLRTIRVMADNAKNDLAREVETELNDLDLKGVPK